MKHQRSYALVALTATLLAACPAQLVGAQVATARVTLRATRGQAEILTHGGWQKMRGDVVADTATAVRTASGAEVVATFQDGSSVRLGETGVLRFSSLADNDVHVKMMGDVVATLSKSRVEHDKMAFDTPTGRATINQAFAVARAVRTEVADAEANIHIQTPTARAVRVAVAQGAATLQAFYNVTGVITGTDPAHNAFTITDNQTGRSRRVVVGDVTVLAHHDNQTAHATRTPRSIVEALAARQSVIVYGAPSGVEGPGDLVAQADNGAINASVVFPEGADHISAEDYVMTNDIPVLGEGVVASAGTTVALAAGAFVPTLAAGIVLEDVVVNQIAFGGSAAGGAGNGTVGAGGAGGSVGTVLAAIGVVTAGGIIASNNRGTATTETPIVSSSSSNTGNLVVTVNRGVRSRANASLGSTSIAPVASFGSEILGSSSLSTFRGSLSGATLAVGTDGNANPSIVGRLPLARNLQLHVGALFNHSDMYSNMTEVDVGVDYFLNPTHALGAGLRTQTFNALDPLGALHQHLVYHARNTIYG